MLQDGEPLRQGNKVIIARPPKKKSKKYHFYRNIAAAFRVAAGKKSVVANLSSSLVERNHKLDHLFSVKEVIMKEKPSKKNDASAADDESDKLDENGYRDIPTVGVSEF